MNNIIYLDAAASALKSESVIQRQVGFLTNEYANAGRGICARAAAVDSSVADVRAKIAKFINAPGPDNIIFTSGTTDGLNRVVHLVCKMDEFANRSITAAVSDIDHHSARMPWIASGANIVLCPMDESWAYDVSQIPVADVFVITAMSNVMGMRQNVSELINAARKKNPNVITVVDAAQYVVHADINASEWGADFICFSGHKIGADTGVGVMYIKNPERFTPDKFGGGMVSRITGSAAIGNYSIQWEPVPAKFEAGTLPVTQIIGLPAAIDYIEKHRPNLELIKYLYDRLSKNENIQIITERDSSMFTFVPKNMHVLDFGVMAGTMGLCLRVGNMCASWIHNLLGLKGSVRISVGPWNSMTDIQKAAYIIEGIIK